jgi:hypothetical protein
MSKESFKKSIQKKEAEFLGKDLEANEDVLSDVEGEEGVVNEDDVVTLIEDLDVKISDSALSEKYRELLRDKLKLKIDGWEQQFEGFKVTEDAKVEVEFKNLYEQSLLEFSGFEKSEGVRRIFDCVEPFYEQEAEVMNIMNLESYSVDGWDWESINLSLGALGFTPKIIKGVQKVLNVTPDGKVGPVTINAINEHIYGVSHKVEFGPSTKHAVLTPEEFTKRGEDSRRIFEGAEWKAIDAETAKKLSAVRKKLASAKTISDIEDYELEERAILKADREAKKELTLRKLAEFDAEGEVVTDPDVDGDDGGDIFDDSVDVVDEIVVFPEDFTKIVFEKLKMSKEVAAVYYQAYEEIPGEDRISWDKIATELDALEAEHLQDIEDPLKTDSMIEAFGKLVNGQGERLLSNTVLSINIKAGKKEIERLNVVLKEEYVQRDTFKNLWSEQHEFIAEIVRANDSIFVNGDPLITGAITHLDRLKVELDASNGKIESYEADLHKYQKQNCVYQYELLKNQGIPTKRFLLAAHAEFGSDFMGEMKEEMDGVVEGAETDESLSPVERLFYSGQYEEALELMAKENKERTKINGFEGGVGPHDVLGAFRSKNETDKWAKRFEARPDSFAAKMMDEGYVPLNVGRSESTKNLPDGVVDPSLSTRLFVAKFNEDGSFSFYWVDSAGNQKGSNLADSPEVQAMMSENLISGEDVDKLDTQTRDMNSMLPLMIQNMPSFSIVESASVVLNTQVAALSDLFSGSSGWKSDDFVGLAKSYAKDIKDSSALKDLKDNLGKAKDDLKSLRDVVDVGFRNELETRIAELELQLFKVSESVEDNKLDDLCDHILSADFQEDTFGRWFLEEGGPMLVAILIATAAIVIATYSLGSGSLLSIAMLSTAAGMVGHEAGTAIFHEVGQGIYGEENFNNKTLFGTYITGEEIYDPNTGENRKVTEEELVKVYGTQFVVGTITTFALLGLGRVVGQWLSRTVVAHGASGGAKGIAARALGRIPKLSRTKVDLAKGKGMDGMMKRIYSEFFQELGEEGAEAGAAATNIPGAEFMVGVWNCLDGRSMEYSYGSHDVVQDSVVKTGENSLQSDWTYDGADIDGFQSTLTSSHQDAEITTTEDGVITVATKYTMKDGTLCENVMVFRPTSESHAMRQLFTEGRGPKGELDSEIERVWGVKKTGDSSYSFDTLKPAKKLSLSDFLKSRGFVIVGDPESGGFQAVKGAEVVVFGNVKASDVISVNEINVNPSGKTSVSLFLEFEAEMMVKEIDRIKDIGLKAKVLEVYNELQGDYSNGNMWLKDKWAAISTDVKSHSLDLYYRLRDGVSRVTASSLEFGSRGVQWVKEQAANLPTTDALRAKTLKVVEGLIAFKDGSSSRLSNLWNEVSGKVAELNAELKTSIDARFNEVIQQKEEEVISEEVFEKEEILLLETEVEKISDFGLKVKVTELLDSLTGRLDRGTDWVSERWNSISSSVKSVSVDLATKLSDGVARFTESSLEFGGKAVEWVNAEIAKLPTKNDLRSRVAGVVDSFVGGVDSRIDSALVIWSELRGVVDSANSSLRLAIDAKAKQLGKVMGKRVERVTEIETEVVVQQNTVEARERRTNEESKEYGEVVRETDVYYMPDIHGDVDAMKNSLKTMGLVDDSGAWIGGNKVLQFSGDYIDRGSKNFATLDYLMQVKSQAEAAGGRIDLLIGNHEAIMISAVLEAEGEFSQKWSWLSNGGDTFVYEVMLSQGNKTQGDQLLSKIQELQSMPRNTRETNQAYWAAVEAMFTDPALNLESAFAETKAMLFSENGRFSEFINSLQAISQVDDMLYVHAGISPKWVGMLKQYGGVDGVNARWQTALENAQNGDFTLFNEFNEIGGSRMEGGVSDVKHGGLFWFDFESDIAKLTDTEIESMCADLKAMGINGIMVGHTRVDSPTLSARFEANGIKLLAADVSISDAYRGGESGNGGVKLSKEGHITSEANGDFYALHFNGVSKEREDRLKSYDLDTSRESLGNLQSLIGHYEAVLRGEASLQEGTITGDHGMFFVSKYDSVKGTDAEMSFVSDLLSHARQQEKILGERIQDLRSGNVEMSFFVERDETMRVALVEALDNPQNIDENLRKINETLDIMGKFPPESRDSEFVVLRDSLLAKRASFLALKSNFETTNNLLNELYPNGFEVPFSQGKTGNCYMLAALHVTRSNPDLMRIIVSQSIKKTGPGKWEVTFLGLDKNKSITVTQAKVDAWKTSFGITGGALGDQIIEVAYASFRSRKKHLEMGWTMIQTEESPDGSYDLAVAGGHGDVALFHLLGGEYSTRYLEYADGKSFEEDGMSNDISGFFENDYISDANYLLTAGSLQHEKGDSEHYEVDGFPMVHGHAYSVTGYDKQSQIVYVVNPHNTAETMHMPFSTFVKAFGNLGYVKVSPLETELSKLNLIEDTEVYVVGLDSFLEGKNIYDIFDFKKDASLDHMQWRLNELVARQKKPAFCRILRDKLQTKLNEEKINIQLWAI